MPAPVGKALERVLARIPDVDKFGEVPKASLRTCLSQIVNIVGDGPRSRALRDLRQWENNRKRLRQEREAAASGYVASVRASEGGLRPWDLGATNTVLGKLASPRAVEVVRWVVATEKCFKRRGVRATHAQWAAMLAASGGRCSERTAGSAVRAAVEAGLLERGPWFSPSCGIKGGANYTQRECCYQLSDLTRSILKGSTKRGFIRSLLAGKSCQPRISRANALSERRIIATRLQIGCIGRQRPEDNANASSMAAPAAAAAAFGEGRAKDPDAALQRAIAKAHEAYDRHFPR